MFIFEANLFTFMQHDIIISDENPNGTIINQVYLSFEQPTVTIEQLIKARVEQEIGAYDASAKASTDNIALRQGPSNKSRHIVFSSFRVNGFFIRVNGKIVHELDQKISIHPNTQVCFVQMR